MPKSHSYGASYPSGAVIAHTGEVLTGPDEGNDAPRIEDASRPGGAENATPIDQDNPQDDRTIAGRQEQDKPEQDEAPAKDEEPAKPTKRTSRSQR